MWWLLGEGEQFSLGMWFLLDRPCAREWPHTQVYMRNTNWTPWVIERKRKKTVKLRGWWQNHARVRGRWRDGYDKKHCMYKKFPSNKLKCVFHKRSPRAQLFAFQYLVFYLCIHWESWSPGDEGVGKLLGNDFVSCLHSKQVFSWVMTKMAILCH